MQITPIRTERHAASHPSIDRSPLFSIFGVHFIAGDSAGIGLFPSILYAVYRYSMEQQARQSSLEQEMQSAREIQRVLIPDTLPSLEGFAISSAYLPAQEVGGDFFQIIREDKGSTIVALGDVSGKCLKAAMSVSLIIGYFAHCPANAPALLRCCRG